MELDRSPVHDSLWIGARVSFSLSLLFFMHLMIGATDSQTFPFSIWRLDATLTGEVGTLP